MRVIVAGSRTVTSRKLVDQCIADALERFESEWMGWGLVVLSGGCRGVDLLAESWAELHGVPVRRYPADWEKFGKAAGPIRNESMAVDAHALVAIWDGSSRGTKHMIDVAKRRHLQICAYNLEGRLCQG